MIERIDVNESYDVSSADLTGETINIKQSTLQ